MMAILDDTMGGREYVQSQTLNIKHVAVDFVLQFVTKNILF